VRNDDNNQHVASSAPAGHLRPWLATKYKYNVTYFQPRLRLALLFARCIPVGTGDVKRTAILRRAGMDLHPGARILGAPDIHYPLLDDCDCATKLHLGDSACLGENCSLTLAADIILETHVAISHNVTILTGTHERGPAERRMGQLSYQPVVIEKGAWIGAHTIIMPGVTIGAGSMVAAGSVVFHSVPPNAMVAGNPARVMKILPPEGESATTAPSATAAMPTPARLVRPSV
jgi:acetyltransferase-like isoleucine patch superfamily enzyme